MVPSQPLPPTRHWAPETVASLRLLWPVAIVGVGWLKPSCLRLAGTSWGVFLWGRRFSAAKEALQQQCASFLPPAHSHTGSAATVQHFWALFCGSPLLLQLLNHHLAPSPGSAVSMGPPLMQWAWWEHPEATPASLNTLKTEFVTSSLIKERVIYRTHNTSKIHLNS